MFSILNGIDMYRAYCNYLKENQTDSTVLLYIHFNFVYMYINIYIYICYLYT